ncbi:hypothetical protein [Gracilinema caldarium]|uniref:hypothetical protein n=1 Tax=Gracilinema caldarium TaxID=215591 RepID=UPI0026EBA427|nr:hypothetical protein [Gracilinema caldarium]
MTTAEALNLFEAQLKAACAPLGVKVLRAPLAIKEPGLVVRIVPRKPFPLVRTTGERAQARKALSVAVLIQNRIDSDRAMVKYLALADLLVDVSNEMTRLVETTSTVSGSRIVWATSPEEAIFDDPADDSVVWLRDEWRVTIYIP